MIAGMMAMMDICVRVRNTNPAYVISSIGVRPNTMRSKRSVMGKIIDTLTIHNPRHDDFRDGLSNESTPIYSVMTPSSSTSPLLSDGCTDALVSSPVLSLSPHSSTEQEPSRQVPAETRPYHEQGSIDIESLSSSIVINTTTTAPNSTFSYSVTNSSGLNVNSFTDNESPILNNILIETSSSSVSNESRSASMTSPIVHSYANGYLSSQRHKRSALVKCEQSNNIKSPHRKFDHLPRGTS